MDIADRGGIVGTVCTATYDVKILAFFFSPQPVNVFPMNISVSILLFPYAAFTIRF